MNTFPRTMLVLAIVSVIVSVIVGTAGVMVAFPGVRAWVCQPVQALCAEADSASPLASTEQMSAERSGPSARVELPPVREYVEPTPEPETLPAQPKSEPEMGGPREDAPEFRDPAPAPAPRQFAALDAGAATPAPVAPAPPPGEYIANPAWAQRPSPTALQHYPQRAARRESGGRVVLDCLVGGDGRLACIVFEEAPVGMGFGAQALRIANGYRMEAVIGGAPTRGRRVRVPVSFRFEEDTLFITGESEFCEPT